MENNRYYRYILDPTSRKILCPSCGKRRFVGMIDQDTGEFLSNFGRCDREVNCGYCNYPLSNSFISQNNIASRQNENLKSSFHEVSSLRDSLFAENNFQRFLKGLFGEFYSQVICNNYLIGTSVDFYNGTVFWQIDDKLRIRAGKIICYDEIGRRSNNINWIHSLLKRQKLITEYNLEQCLFGLHLSIRDSNSTVAIVESEKTACIMSVIYPQFLWMACGSKAEFKAQKLQPIKHRKIIAYPDCEVQKGGKTTFEEWDQKAKLMNQVGFQITVSDLLEVAASESQKLEGIDIADCFATKQYKT